MSYRRQQDRHRHRNRSENGNGAEDAWRYRHHVEARLATVETEVHGIAAGLERLGKAMDHLREDLSRRDRTPWGVLAAWAGVVLLIGGMALQPIRSEQARQDSATDTNAAQLRLLELRLDDIRASRFTRQDGKEHAARTDELEHRIHQLELELAAGGLLRPRR